MHRHQVHSLPLARYSAFTAGVLLAILSLSFGAQAQNIEILYSFCSSINSDGYCTDGAEPVGNIARFDGKIFGATVTGGQHNGGTVFEVNGSAETVLYNFCGIAHCVDGQSPVGGIIADSNGNLYGTTKYGGYYGNGTVFELTQHGQKVLHHFCILTSCDDGSTPLGGLLRASGNLYGTTEAGGRHGSGTAFELILNKNTGTWSHEVIYNFCALTSCKDGASPQSGLVSDSSGNLYGTTQSGGSDNNGTVYKLSPDKYSPSGFKHEVVKNFCTRHSSTEPCEDGAAPVGGLVVGSGGILYGTTQVGGYGNPGNGLVFQLKPDASTGGYDYSILHAFCTSSKCSDGLNPVAGLVFNGTDKLVGTTPASTGGSGGGGTVFTVTISGSENPTYYFCGATCANGKNNGNTPYGGVVLNSVSQIFGTTANGGEHNQGGEVFQLTP
jgi:uncharacterized repeat protein (TIGR03803 family)